MWELVFGYCAEHTYNHQGNTSTSSAEDAECERHVAQGPYFVLDDAAPARYRLDPRVHGILGHPVLHTMLPELLKGLGLTVPGNLTKRYRAYIRMGAARLLYVPPRQTSTEGVQVALMAGGAVALGWLVLRQRRDSGRGRA